MSVITPSRVVRKLPRDDPDDRSRSQDLPRPLLPLTIKQVCQKPQSVVSFGVLKIKHHRWRWWNRVDQQSHEDVLQNGPASGSSDCNINHEGHLKPYCRRITLGCRQNVRCPESTLPQLCQVAVFQFFSERRAPIVASPCPDVARWLFELWVFELCSRGSFTMISIFSAFEFPRERYRMTSLSPRQNLTAVSSKSSASSPFKGTTRKRLPVSRL